MKIKIPIIEYFHQKTKKKLTNIFLKNLDYRLYYNAYTRYVLPLIKETPKNIDFKFVENPKVSIIIPVYNQFDLTMKCLQSIKDNTEMQDYEIILVDDCSIDETKNIEKFVKNVKVIKNKENQGFLKNCNLGAELTRGECLYFLNNDTQLLPKAIDRLLETIYLINSCGVVGSKLVYPSGKLQSAGSGLKKDLSPYLIGHLHNPLSEEFNIQKEVDYVCGASLMTKKTIWEELGGFDEQFSPGYFEETDYCLRARNAGYKVIYEPTSEVVHITGCTFKESAQKLFDINIKKFRKKHNFKYNKTLTGGT